MRLGLLGPSEGDVASLGRAAEFLLNGAKVNRAIYLGTDGALDRAVSAWARKLVGDDPSDDNAWKRAAEVAVKGGPGEIDKFVQIERARLRLKALESLPEKVHRTIEMFGDRVAVLIHDKALLDEEDILAANILVYGKAETPLIKKIGGRWFVTPGVIGSPGGGLAVIEDDRDEVIATVYDGTGKPTTKETLTLQRAAKMRIQGGA
jgi:predicted phosphodiesterase